MTSRRLQPSIELHIEELILHGFAPGDRRPIQDAMQTELERLFTERGLPSALTRDSERSHMDVGGFRLAARPRPRAVGCQIARTLYEGFQPSADAHLQARPGGASP